MAERQRFVNVAVERQHTAAEDEHHGRQERNSRSEDPGGGNGGASHRSIALQFTILQPAKEPKRSLIGEPG